MKKYNVLISLIVIICIFLTGCHDASNSSTNVNNDNFISNEDGSNCGSSYNSTSQKTTAKERLSKTCHKVLCAGSDKDGDFYELVGNQYESYEGFRIEVGVIKNNEWLVPLSSTSPLINEWGKIVDFGALDDKENNIYYINSGCFYIGKGSFRSMGRVSSGTFYNSEIDKTASFYTDTMGDGLFLGYDFQNPSDNKYVISKYAGGFNIDIFILDISTMKITEIASNKEISVLGPYSEGVFLAAYFPTPGEDGKLVFYDSELNEILDLEKYEAFSPEFDAYKGFYENKCSFFVYNELGTKWKLTIDIHGNVLEEKLIED